jgi:hypothetical protein
MTERMDMVFARLASCRKENPNDQRSDFLAKAGYVGPIKQIFATPIMVVEGTGAQGAGLENIRHISESFKKDYATRFHGARCAIKQDSQVTREDIDNHSLVLIGNPQSNSVWEKLQPLLPVKMTASEVLYNNSRLTGDKPFQIIVRHPGAGGKYVLILGAVDLKTLGRLMTGNLFIASYDAITFSPHNITSKLGALGAQMNNEK